MYLYMRSSCTNGGNRAKKVVKVVKVGDFPALRLGDGCTLVLFRVEVVFCGIYYGNRVGWWWESGFLRQN